MFNNSPRIPLVGILLFCTGNLIADEIKVKTIDPSRHHLRSGKTREWTRFPIQSEGTRWEKKFSASRIEEPKTLLIRQADVRLTWKVILNEKELGRLQRDENDLHTYWEIPAGTLVADNNVLTIEGSEDQADDVMVGPIHLIESSTEPWLHETRVQVEVRSDIGQRLPCRLTIVDTEGSLAPIGASSNDQFAVRTGVLYTGNGTATFGLPSGRYQLIVGRGFEYEQVTELLDLSPGDRIRKDLMIRRQVDTTEWIACDTHVHTVTHSGHGDASIRERMITLAGEGIEMPVATDHNVQIDYEPLANELGVRQFFTPLIGNEVTTKFGHFNAFPFRNDVTVPDHSETDWNTLIPAIFEKPDVQVVILNHGRDVHSGYRPFAAENFNEVSGESMNGRPFLFNAMETLNSGAQQTDPLELFRDWLTLINRGYHITPIGSSDSHDVNRYIVGQGRTYVRCEDSDPSQVDVEQACRSICEGRVVVSAGMFVDVSVDQQFGPGDLVPKTDRDLTIHYSVRVPDWIHAERIQLYRNGFKVSDVKIDGTNDLTGNWNVELPKHDVFFSVLALGPGPRDAAWPIAQPYQPDSPDWQPTVFSFTGAIPVDVDGDGEFTSAFDYANKLVDQADGDFSSLCAALKSYDEAVVTQAASLWQEQQSSLLDTQIQASLRRADPHIRTAMFRYLSAWRQSQAAQLER